MSGSSSYAPSHWAGERRPMRESAGTMIEELLDELHHIPGLGSIMRVGRYLYKKLKDWMFLKTIKEAHWEWQRQHGLGTRWEPLGEGIEFSEAFATRPEGPETSRIALRSLDDEYDEITLVIELKSGEGTYDETRRVSNVDKNVRVVILSDIPAYKQFLLITEEDYKRAGLVDDGRNVLRGYSTYESYRVTVTCLTKDGITRSVNLKSNFSTPVDQTLANLTDWIIWKGMEWSGALVNLSVIRAQQEELANRLYKKIGPACIVVSRVPRRNSVVASVRYHLASVVSSEPFVKIVYWVPLILRRRKFDPHVPEPDLPTPAFVA
jgi:hypothetical protein